MPTPPLLSRLDLRWRFLLVLMPVTLGATVGMGLVARHVLCASYEREARTAALARLRAHVLPLTTRLRTLDQSLDRLADHAGPDLHPAESDDPERARQRWNRDVSSFLAQWSEVEEVFCVHAEDGRVRFTRSDRERVRSETLDPDDLPVWARSGIERESAHAVAAGTAGRQRLSVLEEGGVQVPTMALPLRGGSGRIGVVLRSAALVDPLEALVAGTEGARIVVLDDHGVEVLRSGDHEPLAAETRTELLRAASGSRSGFSELRPEAAGSRRVAVLHVDAALGLIVAHLVPRTHFEGDLASLDRAMIVLALSAFGLAAAVILLLTRRVVVPIERLTQTMSEVARGDLAQRLPVSGDDEIAQLSRSFNTMISDLHTTHVALEQQSARLSAALREVEDVEAMKDSFLALVSHEVRTPLTSIMGGVEFLRDEFAQQHDEIQTEFMGIVYESARRLAGFMNDAILMASLQASRSRSEFDTLSVTALLRSKFDEIVAPAATRGLVVENRTRSQHEFFVQGDWTLLQVAIEKILNNAVRHNRPQGRVVLEIVDRVLEDTGAGLASRPFDREATAHEASSIWRAVRVFNTGPIIAPERIETLFARFELTHDIANHQRGSGLSLPIAHYILAYHGGRIEVRRVEDEGMAFYLVLPGRLAAQPRSGAVVLPRDIDDTVTTAHLVRAAAAEVERLDAESQPAAGSDPRRRHERGESPSGTAQTVEVELEEAPAGRT